MFQQFQDKWTDKDSFWEFLTDYFGTTNELVNFDNWFIGDKIKDLLYNYFKSHNITKYFIWEDNDIRDIKLNGDFKTDCIEMLYTLYLNQQVLNTNSLSQLKDNTNWGNKKNSRVYGGTGGYSNSLNSDQADGVIWNKDKDIAWEKKDAYENENNTNLLSSINKFNSFKLMFDKTITDIGWKFEKYFINKKWVDKYEISTC